jgi:hypothetical protein
LDFRYIPPELHDVGQRTPRGAIAGIVSGLVFLIATMGYVTTKGLPAVASMIDISTIFHGRIGRFRIRTTSWSGS